MRMARIARILEFVGDCLPGVHELTLLVPAFFGLYSAARALGFEVDLGLEAVVVIAVTFSCFVWTLLNNLTWRGTVRLEETTNELPWPGHSLGASPSLREPTQKEKHSPARLP